MIKNVIFDFGQVLVRFEPKYMTEQYIKEPVAAAILARIIFDRLYWDRLDAGTITDEEVMEGVMSRIPERHHESARAVYENWFRHLPEIPGMRELLLSLKAEGRQLYLCSNISKGFAAHADEIPILSFFDGCVFSGPIGLVKPSREIFDHLLDKYGLDPAECVFVDDREDNIAGAEAAGIRGILFDGDTDALRRKLAEMER